MQPIEEILANHHFFKGLGLANIEVISACASFASYRAGEFIFREGEEAHSFFVLRDGKVTVETFVPGRGPITLQTVGAGDVIGWSWLFPPYKWTFDARALDATNVIVFDGHCLRAKGDADHDLGYILMERFAHIIVDRLQATRMQLLELKF